MNEEIKVSLSKAQVKSILSALWIYEQTGDGLNDQELRDFGYSQNTELHEQIYHQLRTFGWDC